MLARTTLRAGASYLQKRFFSFSSRTVRSEGKMNGVTSETNESLFHNKNQLGEHTFFADEPVAAGGSNKAPTPYGIKSISAMIAKFWPTQSSPSISALYIPAYVSYIRMYASRKGLPLEKTVVNVSHSIVSKPSPTGAVAKVNQIEREIEFVGKTLTAADRERLLVIANKCPVHNALESEKNIVITTLKQSL